MRLAVLLSLFGAWGGAFAAATKDVPAARAAVAAARKSYELGKFEEAIGAYTQAYELTDAPALLFNLAQCHRQLKQYERAAFFYGRYLSLQPRPIENEATARALLAETEAAAAQEAAAKAEAAREQAERERAESQQADQGSAVPPEALPAPPPPLPPPAPADPPAPLVKQWWLWTLVGVVVVGGAVTAGVLASGGGASAPPYTTLDDVHF